MSIGIRSVLPVVFLILLVPCLCERAGAENWPAWRGPRGDGSSLERNLPDRWNGPRGENIAWKVEIPGKGHASPVVWEDRIFVVSCREESEDRLLVCLDRASGRVLWQRVVLHAPLERKNTLNSCASSTPAADGKLVYVTFLESDPQAPVNTAGAKYAEPARFTGLDGRGRLRFRRQPSLAGPPGRIQQPSRLLQPAAAVRRSGDYQR